MKNSLSDLEILNKLILGEITLDFKGHRVFNLQSKLRRTLNKFSDLEDSKEKTHYLENGYSWDEFRSLRHNNEFWLWLYRNFDTEHNKNTFCLRIHLSECHNCGSYLDLYNLIIDRKTLEYKIEDYEKELETCSFTSKEITETTIQIDKDLVFRNFFLNQDDEYPFDSSSLNTLKGREELILNHADNNIISQQTSNMSVYVYQNDNSLIIFAYELEWLEEMYEDAENLKMVEDLKEKYKDYTYKGSVSCEVWRYTASSSSNIKKLNLKKDHYDDEVLVNLDSGEYKVNHYNNFDILISEIEKV